MDCSFNLAGHVRHQGLPVAAVRVFLHDIFSASNEPLKETSTGTRGEFSFSVRSGVYRLEFEPAPSTRFLRQTLDEIKAVTNTNLNIALSTGCIVSGEIRGLDGFGDSNGKPEERFQVEVVALGIEPSSYRGTAFVEDGRFSLVVPRGKYHLALRDAAPVEFSGPHFVCSETEVIDVGGDCDIALRMPELKKFAGDIKDVFGSPVNQARLKIAAASSGNLILGEFNFSSEMLSEEGHVKLWFSDGLYDCKIDPPAGSLLFGLVEDQIDPDGHSFALAEGHRLRGQVFFKEQVLSQCLVRVQSSEKKQEYITRTDGDGNFSISLPGGSYKIIVSAHPKDAPTIVIDGAEYSSLAPWTRTVIVGGDTHVAVRLSEGTALKGRVCDDSGQSRPSVKLSVFAASDKDKGPDLQEGTLAHGITDGEGRYCLFLSPGSYWLMVHQDLGSARLVSMDGEPLVQDIVWHGWTQLKFEVHGEDGTPVPRCQVAYHPYGHDEESELPHGYVLTGEGGACKLTLPAGVYTFRFTPPQAGSFQAKTIRQLSISADITRKITLEHK